MWLRGDQIISHESAMKGAVIIMVFPLCDLISEMIRVG